MGFRRLGALACASAALLPALPGSAGAATARIAKVGPAPAGQALDLVLPLSADLAGLKRTALAVTTPGSPQYGHYVPLPELARRFGASAANRQRLVRYLRAAGARHVQIDPTGLFADATMSAAQAARVFATPLSEFRNDQGTQFVAPSNSQSTSASAAASRRVPTGLKGLITGVIGLDGRPLTGTARLAHGRSQGRAVAHLRAHAASQASSAAPRTGTPSGCAGGVNSGGFTPNQYLSAYGYDSLRSANITGQGERVALIEVDGFKYSDLEAFASCFGLPIPALNTYGVGISRLLAPGGESTLDLEVLDASAPGLASINVFETKSSAADTLRALTAPLHIKEKPQVISASLGLCEPSLLHFVGNAGTYSTEGALQMAAASGITFVASSGDQGSADCTSSSGRPVHSVAVNYPSSSWWVTGVGGTNLTLNASNQIISQLVWNDAAAQPASAGGGGPSILFRRPSYQNGSTRSKTRAVPDVSMLADIAPGYAIFCSASDPNCISPSNSNPWEALGGTSAATPLLAGGLAIIDEQLRTAGEEPLGLVNPLLYATLHSSSAASVFDDVTAIGNDVGPDFGNHRPLRCCSAGVGYDQASGIGSVNLAGLGAEALARQPPIVGVTLSLPAHQRPVRQQAIKATVGCTGACAMGAYAEVTVGRSKPFEVDSNVTRLRRPGAQTVLLRFSARQLSTLHAALAAHRRITASVHGVLLNPAVFSVAGQPGGSIEARTAAKQLTLGG